MRETQGLLNRVINNLPVELHIPGYQFCGPGTRLNQRLALKQTGVNLLDSACKEHDIAYSTHQDLKHRHDADRILAEKASDRAKDKHAKYSERIAAWAINKAMKAKVKFGMGIQKPSLKTAIQKARIAIRKAKPKTKKVAIQIALRAAKQAIGARKKMVQIPRVVPIAKHGGILPLLIPLFAGLSAVGGLAGGAAGIAKAVNDASNAQKKLDENKRHNQTMEAIALGKRGNGLQLAPYKKGYGLYLHPYQKKKIF